MLLSRPRILRRAGSVIGRLDGRLKDSLGPRSLVNKIYQHLNSQIDILGWRNHGITPLGLALALLVTALLVSLMYTGVGLYAVTFGAIAILLALEAIDFLASRKRRFLRERYAAYVNTFAGYFAVSGNTLDALKGSALPSYGTLAAVIKEEVAKYEQGIAGLEALYEGLARRIGLPSYQKFFRLLKTCEIYGGNVRRLLQKLQEQLLTSIEAETVVGQNSQFGVMIIYAMLVFDLIAFRTAITDPGTANMLATTSLGGLILIYNVFAVLIALIIARSIRRTT